MRMSFCGNKSFDVLFAQHVSKALESQRSLRSFGVGGYVAPVVGAALLKGLSKSPIINKLFV